MNVSLTSELEEFVNQKVQSGHYASASEVIREGLRRMMERDALKAARLAQLRDAVQLGEDQIERGEFVEYTVDELPQLAEAIKAEGRKRRADKADS